MSLDTVLAIPEQESPSQRHASCWVAFQAQPVQHHRSVQQLKILPVAGLPGRRDCKFADPQRVLPEPQQQAQQQQRYQAGRAQALPVTTRAEKAGLIGVVCVIRRRPFQSISFCAAGLRPAESRTRAPIAALLLRLSSPLKPRLKTAYPGSKNRFFTIAWFNLLGKGAGRNQGDDDAANGDAGPLHYSPQVLQARFQSIPTQAE